jgi:hypothetical protein
MNIKKELREKMRPLMDDYQKSMAVLQRMKRLPDYCSKNDIEKQEAATKEALDGVNKEGKKLVEAYRASIRGSDALKGDEMTADIKLLNPAVKPTANDLAAAFDRNESRTMRRLIVEYCSENRIDIHRTFYTEADKMKAANILDNFVDSVTQRPEYSDTFLSDDYFSGNLPEVDE